MLDHAASTSLPWTVGLCCVFASILSHSCHPRKSMGAWCRLPHCSGDWGNGPSCSLAFAQPDMMAESPVRMWELRCTNQRIQQGLKRLKHADGPMLRSTGGPGLPGQPGLVRSSLPSGSAWASEVQALIGWIQGWSFSPATAGGDQHLGGNVWLHPTCATVPSQNQRHN